MENIKACIRIKPILCNTEDEIICDKYDETSVINHRTNEIYSFEQVFDSQVTTDMIFSRIGQPLIDGFFEGVNVCVFAYGQTSSGKTHTMKGNKNSPGFIPQALSEIFEKIARISERSYEIRCSYIEIYNENLIDLLNPMGTNLEIRENLVKGIHIPNLTEMVAQSHKEAFQFFEMGESARKIGETSLNEESSRSHTIFRVTIESKGKSQTDKILSSTLNLVDLAGSEGVSRAKTEGIRKKEGANINKSLLALSNVISKLASKESSYINYRDSKLTRLLQPCLGGNSRTVVICTINPLLSNYQESLNTLKFAITAGAIKNQVQVNEKTTVCSSLLCKEQLKEYTELKTVLSKNKETFENVLRTHLDKIDELQHTLVNLQQENDRGKASLAQAMEDLTFFVQKCEMKDQLINELEQENKALSISVEKSNVESSNQLQRTEKCSEKTISELSTELDILKQENHKLKEERSKLALEQPRPDINSQSTNTDQNEIIEPLNLRRIRSEYELKLIEIETTLKKKIAERNKTIIETECQVAVLARELQHRNEKISELENQLSCLKFQTPLNQRIINKENDETAILENSQKRQKLENDDFLAHHTQEKMTVFKKLQMVLRHLHKRNTKKRLLKKDQTKTLPEDTNFDIEIDSQLGNNLSLFERNF